MFNGFKTAKKRYYNSFRNFDEENKPKKGLRHWIYSVWTILHIRIGMIYEKSKYKTKLLSIHNRIYAFPYTIVSILKRIIMFPFRLIAIPFGWLIYITTRPMRDRHEYGDYELDQVKRRYPNASLVKCEKCDYEIGFRLDKEGNKGWRYTEYRDKWYKREGSRRITSKITDILIKLGIRWENAYYLDNDGEFTDETCSLDESMEYVSSDGDCIFSLDGFEGDVCGGCVGQVWTYGTRFKVYESGDRLTFNHRDGMARPHDCSEVGDYWDEIALHLGYKEQNEKEPTKELKDLDITVDSGENDEKYALVEIADELDVPLFADGCGTLHLYCLPEHYQIFHQGHLEYMDNGEINTKALKDKFQKEL